MKAQLNVAINTRQMIGNSLQKEANATLVMSKQQTVLFLNEWLCKVGSQTGNVARPHLHACGNAEACIHPLVALGGYPSVST